MCQNHPLRTANLTQLMLWQEAAVLAN